LFSSHCRELASKRQRGLRLPVSDDDTFEPATHERWPVNVRHGQRGVGGRPGAGDP